MTPLERCNEPGLPGHIFPEEWREFPPMHPCAPHGRYKTCQCGEIEHRKYLDTDSFSTHSYRPAE